MLFLDLLPGLPEKQIRADRRPENRHQRHRMRLVHREAWHQNSAHSLLPRDIGDKQHRNIGQQRKRGPFEDAGIAIIADQHFKQDADNPEDDRVEQHWTRDQQRQRRPHRAKVCAQIDDIGDQQQQHHAPQQGLGIMAAKVMRDPPPGSRPDPRADRLNRGEQRKTEQHGPGHSIAELRPNLAVGADARRIVVRSPGHQPRPKHIEHSALCGLLAHAVADGLSALIASDTRASISSRESPVGIVSPNRMVIVPRRFQPRWYSGPLLTAIGTTGRSSSL